MQLKYDLHSHSTASDGSLSPTQLIQRAKNQQVTHLALTDHDTTQGIAEAQLVAQTANIELITGIELSTTWEKKCLHVIGLGIDPTAEALTTGIAELQQLRRERAQKMADKLAKKGITGVYEQVMNRVGQGMVTRSHFADFLFHAGYVSTRQKAFDDYLGDGKSAYVATQWIGMEEGINWITQAGGVAVLAHPLRYKLTASWMRRLLVAFKNAGGIGIEVVTGRSSPENIQLSCDYAKTFDLAASAGSDFHSPENQWVELGRLAALPDTLTPVWEHLRCNKDRG